MDESEARHSRMLRWLLAAVLAVAGVTLAPVGSAGAAPMVHIVQLGDSYSAGNGTGHYTEMNCWRSPDSYGAQVAASLPKAKYRNVACSGGTVKDILNPRALGTSTPRTATYTIDPGTFADQISQWEALAKSSKLCGRAPQTDMYFTFDATAASVAGDQMTATAQCQLWTRAQIDAVNPSVSMVFLTIGGNDLGFSTIVTYCMVARSAPACAGELAKANAALETMIADTQAALTKVDRKTKGRADIYLLGYPFLMNTDSYGIPETAPTYDAGAALAELQRAGDTSQAAIMATLNDLPGGDRFHFVDVKPAWEQHTHGLDPQLAANNSDAWLVPVFAPGRQVAEWAHPTQPGWSATATALLEAVTG